MSFNSFLLLIKFILKVIKLVVYNLIKTVKKNKFNFYSLIIKYVSFF